MEETIAMNGQPHEACNPAAPPHWRWETAQRIVDGSAMLGNYSDSVIERAVEYLRCDDDKLYSAIHAARIVFERNDPVGWELEARLAAGQSDAEIAHCCRVPEEVVATYEPLFFDVRHNLSASDWLLSHVVGSGRVYGFRNDEVRQVWAWTSLAGGALVVNEFVDAFHRAMRDDDEPTLSVYLREGADVRLGLQAYIAGLVIPCTDSGDKWNFEFGLRLREAEAITDPERSHAAVQQLQRDVISIARKALAGQPLGDPPVRERSTKRASHSEVDRPTTTRTVQDQMVPRSSPGTI